MQNVPKIVRQRLKAAMPAVNHPDADVLAAFAECSLPELERAAVLEHMARCGDCREIVALALPAMEPVETGISRSPSPSIGGWLSWPSLRWGFVAAGLLAIASFGVLQYERRLQSPSMASQQTGHVEVAANESKKAIAPFVAAPSEKKDKLQSPAAPAFADSVDRANAVDEKKSVARDEEPAALGVAPQSGTGFSAVHGAVVAGRLSHGPRVANQWQQQNTVQNQAPMPAPPSAYSKQENAAGDQSANRSAPAGSENVEVTGAAPTISTQNAEVAQVRDQTAGKTDRIDRAKPPVARASAGEDVISNQPTQDQAVRRLKAQVVPGQISGFVVDPSGAVVSNARITITPSNKGVTATAVTDSQGAWLIAGLPTGNYKAEAEAPGFKTTVLDFSYDAGQPSMYRFTLSPGSVSETVEVSGQSAQLQAATSTIGGPIISRREVSQTPISGRSASSLIALTPESAPRWTLSASGGLQRSLDQGHTWQPVDVTANPSSFSFTGDTSVEIVAKPSRAKAAKETANEKDADKARKQVAAPLTFRAVAASGADVWAGGSAGALYHSLDAGNHWTRIVPADAGAILTGDVISLEFPDPQHGKVSTSTSEIWITKDDGQTWQKQ